MRLSFSKNNLVSAINIASKAVPSRTSLPILECLLLSASNGRITLTANDMEMGIRTDAPGIILEEGLIAVDAKLFSEIIRKLPEEEVLINTDDNLQVSITSGKAKFVISGKDGNDFVDLPTAEAVDPVLIPQLTLKEIIDQTIFSTAPNENNKMMTGELFEIKGGNLRVAALDGHRIAIRNTALPEMYADRSVIVPGKALSDISRILGSDAEKKVEIYIGKNQILFRFDGTDVMSRLIEGEYFRINQMISSNYATRMKVNRKAFLDCIDRSVLLVRETDKKPLVLDIRDGEVMLSMNSIIGMMKEELPIEKEGNDLAIGFNPRFLIDALRVISDEEITLYMTNSRAPGFMRDEEGSYIYLILPVNFVR